MAEVTLQVDDEVIEVLKQRAEELGVDVTELMAGVAKMHAELIKDGGDQGEIGALERALDILDGKCKNIHN